MHNRRRWLQIALVVAGVACLLVDPLMLLWPSGWVWSPPQHEYEQRIIAIDATLGIFLLWAARCPEEQRNLLWFTVWSSLVHGGLMAVQAMADEHERGHLTGDVPALFIVAVVLGIPAPRKKREHSA